MEIPFPAAVSPTTFPSRGTYRSERTLKSLRMVGRVKHEALNKCLFHNITHINLLELLEVYSKLKGHDISDVVDI